MKAAWSGGNMGVGQEGLPAKAKEVGGMPEYRALFAAAFLAEACERANRDPLTIAPAAMQTLLTHRWPGNVRELRQAIDQAVLRARSAAVEPCDLPVLV